MLAGAGSNVCCYHGFGTLVSTGTGLTRGSSIFPVNFESKVLAPHLGHVRRIPPRSSGVLRVGAMNLDGAVGLYEIASQVPTSLYTLSKEITEGPIELPPELLDPLAIPEASPLQLAASVVLTGLITVLLFRSIRRRSRKAKEKKFRSFDGSPKSIKEDARKSALAMLNKAPEVETSPLDILQTLGGAAVAGAIALVLYKFTVTVEGGFADKVVSTNYSIRNLTITVRTIITGICYLATFVFAANCIGLTLLSLQMALNIGGSSTSQESKSGDGSSKSEIREGEQSTDEDRGSST